jgi:hypothetical protein
MGLVAVGLVLVCWRMLRGKSAGWLINSNLAAAGALLTLFAFVDSGGIAAQWNVRHAREIDGTGAQLDLCYLRGLGGSALLPLAELEQQPLAPELLQRVSQTREEIQRELAETVRGGGWSLLGEHRLSQVAPIAAVPPQDSRLLYACDGLYPDLAEEPAAPALTEGTEP